MGKLGLDHIRKEYNINSLDEQRVSRDPLEQFTNWFKDAIDSGLDEPTAMFLATVSKEGQPSGRIVLLKGFDENGFVFFTNYSSRKGEEIDQNPLVALAFFWKELERQVRITGRVERIPLHDSEIYFKSRPRDSQVSASVSPQSKVVPGRKYLEDLRMEFIEKHGDEDLKRPFSWGGYLVVPETIEFWQGREHRLHDRIHYRKDKSQWIMERLAP
jgi:pyridoxamine 5'-phosphate oxidase